MDWKEIITGIQYFIFFYYTQEWNEKKKKKSFLASYTASDSICN